MMEVILTACVLKNDGSPVFCKRHGGGIFVKNNIYNEHTTQEQQGFWTNENRFLNRKEAFELASKNGQLKKLTEDGSIIYYGDRDELYSEDLW